MAEQYVSLKVVHDRVTQHPLMQSITLDAIIRYTVDFMQIVGVPNIFINKITTEVADKGRVKLPCDYIELIQMRGKSGVYRYTSDSFHLINSTARTLNNSSTSTSDLIREVNTTVDTNGNVVSTNSRSVLNDNSNTPYYVSDTTNRQENTFMIQNGYIYLSNLDDVVEISYRAIITDSEGMPMVPDDSKFMRALLAYIKQEYFTILFDLGSVTPQVLNQAQQDYAWAVGSCETNFHKLDLSKVESLFNSLNSMIPHKNQFAHGFRYNNVGTKLRSK